MSGEQPRDPRELGIEPTKEQGTKDQLLKQVNDFVRELQKKEMKADAIIAQKLSQRIQMYQQTLNENAVALKKAGRGNTVAAELHHKQQWLPVTWEVGKKGGAIFNRAGFGPGFSSDQMKFDSYSPEAINKSADLKTRVANAAAGESPQEFINYHFSPEAELVLYRSFGVLQKDQDLGDLPEFQDYRGKDPYFKSLPTNVEGISMHIYKDSGIARKDELKEQGLILEFNQQYIKNQIA